MGPDNHQGQPATLPASQPSTPARSRLELITIIALFVLACLVILGMVAPSLFGSFLKYPLLVFAILAVRAFYNDSRKNASSSDKTVHLFKVLVKVGLITVGVIVGFIMLVIALLAQSGV